LHYTENTELRNEIIAHYDNKKKELNMKRQAFQPTGIEDIFLLRIG